MAARYFGQAPAVGRTLNARFGESDGSEQHQVIGVVADTRYDLRKPAAPTIYIPLLLRSLERFTCGSAGRCPGPNDGSAPRRSARGESDAARHRCPPAIGRRGSDAAARAAPRPPLGFFALVGLVLAGVGLYGVLSYSVVQRTREIGIRVALGARQLNVVKAVLVDAGVAAIAGAAGGLAAGFTWRVSSRACSSR